MNMANRLCTGTCILKQDPPGYIMLMTVLVMIKS